MTDSKKRIITLQSKNNVNTFRFNMDALSNRNVEKLHELIDSLLNMKVSNSVLLRRAIVLYRLHFMEAAYDILQKAESPEERILMLADWIEAERLGLKNAANSVLADIDEQEDF